METFFSLLERHVQVCHSLLCVGLDPSPADLPAPTAEAALEFCLGLIKATVPYAAAYKPNAAFFEAFGPEGWGALKQVIDAIRAESQRIGSVIPVILDAKRGDIASTAEAYAESAFKRLGAQAITLSPYLGKDSIDPFIADPERGVFLVCKTSNPGSTDLQDLTVDRSSPTWDGSSTHGSSSMALLYEHVALLAQQWNTNHNIGLVVGATQPEALRRVRLLSPELWILAPGVGVQGGDLEQALEAGMRADGSGILVTVSRGLSRAKDPARAAAELRDEIEHFRYTLAGAQKTGREKHLVSHSALGVFADGLLEAGCIRFGDFTLKSGLKSPIYIDLRWLGTYPKLLAQAASAYLPILQKLTFDRLAGLPYAAIPIATAICLQGDYPLIYPRKEVKAYGTKAEIEGDFHPGETAVVIDDLATTGSSKFEAIQKLTAAGLKVKDVVVLIDRQSGAKEALAEAGFGLHAVVTLTDLLDYWERLGKVEQDKIAATREFIKKNG